MLFLAWLSCQREDTDSNRHLARSFWLSEGKISTILCCVSRVVGMFFYWKILLEVTSWMSQFPLCHKHYQLTELDLVFSLPECCYPSCFGDHIVVISFAFSEPNTHCFSALGLCSLRDLRGLHLYLHLHKHNLWHLILKICAIGKRQQSLLQSLSSPHWGMSWFSLMSEWNVS